MTLGKPLYICSSPLVDRGLLVTRVALKGWSCKGVSLLTLVKQLCTFIVQVCKETEL